MEKITLALQKSGRLSDSSLKLLKQCGIHLPNGNRKLKTTATDFPLEVLFLRDDDIPQYVEEGVADLGILGKDVVLESQKKVSIIRDLGFSRCRLCLAVPRDVEYGSISYFEGRRIATSFPRLLSEFLEQQGVKAQIEEISGSVEIAPSIGLADGICDLVSSGSTLLMNGLRAVETILESEAVIIGNSDGLKTRPESIEKLLFRLDAVQRARSGKYITLNAPNEALNKIREILPGMKSPTVIPLAEEGWSAVHSVVQEKDFWERIDQLKQAGAEGILVIPIEKMML